MYIAGPGKIWRGYRCENTLLLEEYVARASLLVRREQEGGLLPARSEEYTHTIREKRKSDET
jgi:hypothetical protein